MDDSGFEEDEGKAMLPVPAERMRSRFVAGAAVPARSLPAGVA
jgi:hypothetical protein